MRQLAELPPSLRGWSLDVLRAIRRLGKAEFSLQELYGFETELKSLTRRIKIYVPSCGSSFKFLGT